MSQFRKVSKNRPADAEDSDQIEFYLSYRENTVILVEIDVLCAQYGVAAIEGMTKMRNTLEKYHKSVD